MQLLQLVGWPPSPNCVYTLRMTWKNTSTTVTTSHRQHLMLQCQASPLVISMGLATHSRSEFAHRALTDIVQYGLHESLYSMIVINTYHSSRKTSVSRKKWLCSEIISKQPETNVFNWTHTSHHRTIPRNPAIYPSWNARSASPNLNLVPWPPAMNGSLVPHSSIRMIYWVFQEHWELYVYM